VAEKPYVRHLTRGGELLRSDRLAEARVELEKANALKPGDGKILNLLGLAHFRLGEYTQARAIYADLVKRQPRDASLRLNLGLVYLKMGSADEAIAELTKVQELDPKLPRTAGYLGLAYARKGEFARAREMFLAAGQAELAKEMEQQIAAGPNGKTAEAGAPSAVMRETSGPVLDPAEVGAEMEEDDDEPGTEVSVPVLAAPEGSVPLAAAPSGSAPTAAAGGGAPAAPEAAPAPALAPSAPPAASTIEVGGEERRGFAAPRISWPGGQEGHRAPIPVSEFATARLVRPDDGDLPFELAAGGTLIVRVRGRLMSRTEGVVVSGGELAYEPATKRVRGRNNEDPFGTEERPMFIVSGIGHLVAAPAGGVFTALELQDDIVYLREDFVFAFEEHLGWENGHVPGSGASIDVVQFRGAGCVVLRTRKAPISVKLAAEKVLYVDAGVMAGWIGRVVPRVVAPAAGGESSAPFVECTGEGVVLIEEPADPGAVPAAEAAPASASAPASEAPEAPEAK
jgi:uncharacterized protein (AIM24 family)